MYKIKKVRMIRNLDVAEALDVTESLKVKNQDQWSKIPLYCTLARD